MNKIEQQKIDAANTAYFRALAHSRASLYQLQIYLLAAVPIGGIVSWILYAEKSYNRPDLAIPLNIFLALTLFGTVIGISSFSTKLLFRFQILFSFLLALTVGMITIFTSGIAYILATVDSVKGSNLLPPSSYTSFVLFLGILVFSISLIVNARLLKQRLQVGFSEQRTQKNFLATFKTYKSKSFWIIFGLMMVVPNLLTKGVYLTNIFGIFSLLLFSSVFPSPIVEFSYLAYLKTQDKKYWQEKPEEVKKSSEEKKAHILKLVKWGYIIGSIVLFLIFAQVYYEQDPPPEIPQRLSQIFIISWGVFFILWLRKKIKNYFQTRKENKK